MKLNADRNAVKLICLPHSGSSASTCYSSWVGNLGEEVDVIPFDVPERVQPDAGVLDVIDACAKDIAKMVDGPWVLLGHSFGGGLAAHVATVLARTGQAPKCLVISGRAAPQPGRDKADWAQISDDALLDRVQRWGALPPEFLSLPGLRQAAAKRIRRDLIWSDTLHRMDLAVPNDIQVQVLCGAADPLAPWEKCSAWKDFAGEHTSVSVYDGGHFFLHEGAQPVDELRTFLASVA